MNPTPSIRITILSSWYRTDTLTFKNHPFILHISDLHSFWKVVSFDALVLAFISQSGFLFCASSSYHPLKIPNGCIRSHPNPRYQVPPDYAYLILLFVCWRTQPTSRYLCCFYLTISMAPVVRIEPNGSQTLLSHDDSTYDLVAYGWYGFIKQFEGFNLIVA